MKHTRDPVGRGDRRDRTEPSWASCKDFRGAECIHQKSKLCFHAKEEEFLHFFLTRGHENSLSSQQRRARAQWGTIEWGWVVIHHQLWPGKDALFPSHASMQNFIYLDTLLVEGLRSPLFFFPAFFLKVIRFSLSLHFKIKAQNRFQSSFNPHCCRTAL